MNLTPPRLTHSALLTGVLALTLISCTNTTPPATPDPTPALPPTVTDGMTALVHGPVNSPVHDRLKELVSVVAHDGSQSAADYDLLVFDGDAHTPEEIREHPLVDEAMDAGKWVLGLDLSYAHKKEGLYGWLGATTEGDSLGFLARKGRSPEGYPAAYISEMNPVRSATRGEPMIRPGAGAAGALPASPESPVLNAAAPNAAALTRRSAAAFARKVVTRVETEGVRLEAQDGPPIPAVPGLFAKQYFFDNGTGDVYTIGPSAHNWENGQHQYANFRYNHVFTLYLDNADNPQGNFQWIALDTDITANPSNGGVFACMGCYNNGADAPYDEFAWFLWNVLFVVYPVQGDLLTPEGSSPTTQNNVTSYTTGLSFTGGVSLSDKPGVNGSFEYSNQVTRNLTDWKLSNSDVNNAYGWFYGTQNPWTTDDLYSGFGTDGYPYAPNDISKTQLQLHVQGAWKTKQVLTQDLTFNTSYQYNLADAWCDQDGNLICVGNIGSVLAKNKDARGFTINMQSVVPIPLKRANPDSYIAFEPTVAKAGQPVTATITLASAAVEDTDIPLNNYSQTVNVDVPEKVTVPQGETSVSFTMLTNTNGLAPGASVTADINAFYGGEYESQLVIQN